MCLQDWRLGRLIRAVPRSFTMGVAGTETFTANKQRVGFSVGIAARLIAVGETVEVSFDGQAFTFLYSAKPDLHITVATHGDLPMREILVTNGGIIANVGIIEYFLPEEFLTAGLDEFKKAVGL